MSSIFLNTSTTCFHLGFSENNLILGIFGLRVLHQSDYSLTITVLSQTLTLGYMFSYNHDDKQTQLNASKNIYNITCLKWIWIQHCFLYFISINILKYGYNAQVVNLDPRNSPYSSSTVVQNKLGFSAQ